MKRGAIAFAAVFLSAVLLFGCASQGAAISGTPQAPAPGTPQGGISINVSANGSNAAVNESAALPEEEEADPYANITPRNISGKISDGQFRAVEGFSSPLKVYVIDGGQADSVLVSKGEFYMLVDAGNFAAANALLKKLGVKRLNVLVATRDYEGAIGGMESILDSYQVDELWENGAAQPGTSYAAVLGKARAKGITIKAPEAKDTLSFGGLAVTALNPAAQRSYSNPDSDSIVLKLSSGSFCMLLLNPTVQERENAIISAGEKLRCDAITYYRHGEGRPVPSLILENYALPKDVIISVGKNNTGGLPSNTTLTRLALKSVAVWRTDIDGTVLVENDGIGGAYNVSRYG